jgi:peptide chain release factor 1
MQKLAKEHADIRELVDTLRVYRQISTRIEEAREMQKDPEMRDLARQEETELAAEQAGLEERLKLLLLPKDPNDDKNILLEIRGGTGGEEAALFASDLFRMYTRFAERRRWKVEILSMSSASAGGLKEVVAAVEGGAPTPTSSTNRACTAYSACPAPRRRAASIPPQRRWPSCPSLRTWKSTSIPRI